jgi:hypothetical protein
MLRRRGRDRPDPLRDESGLAPDLLAVTPLAQIIAVMFVGS